MHRILPYLAIVTLLCGSAVADPGEREIAEYTFGVFEQARKDAAESKSGARLDIGFDEARRSWDHFRLGRSVAWAADQVIAGQGGWAQRLRLLDLERGSFTHVATATGEVRMVDGIDNRWMEVSRYLGVGEGSTLWGAANLFFGDIAWRGRSWKVSMPEIKIHDLARDQAGLWAHLDARATYLLGACEGTGCARQGRKDLAWVRETLELARAQKTELVPQTSAAERGTLVFRIEVEDKKGNQRRLTIEDQGLRLPHWSTWKVSPQRITGEELRPDAKGMVVRHFHRAHFDYERRVRVVRPARRLSK